MSRCLEEQAGSYVETSNDPATCEYVLLDADEFQVMQDYQASLDPAFNTELYDLAFYSTLEMWAIGLGVGLVLAMIFKLKR